MSLYTIGDLHFGSELIAKNQIEGRVCQNHEEIFRRNCETNAAFNFIDKDYRA